MKVKNINFCNIVTLGVDLKKLKYKTSKKETIFYNSKTPRRDNLEFENKDYLNQCIKICTEEMMKSYNQNYSFKYIYTPLWEHRYKKDDFQEDHVHYRHHFSFVIYYKGDSSIMLKNPSGYLIQAMYPDFDEHLATFEYEPCLKEGTMLMFPSYVAHYVKKSTNTISLVGDVSIDRGENLV
jgi:hypothetical protein